MRKIGGLVFISYAHARRPLIKEVAEQVSEKGINVWFDRNIKENTLWSGELIEKIKSAALFVLVLDRFSNDSMHVLAEVQHAFSNHIPIIIIQLENAEPSAALSYFIGGIQYVSAVADAESISKALLQFLGEEWVVQERISIFSMLFLYPVVYWIYGKRWVSILSAFMVLLFWGVSVVSLPKDSFSFLLGGIIISLPFWAGLVAWIRAISRERGNRKVAYQKASVIKKTNSVAPWVAVIVIVCLITAAVLYPPKDRAKDNDNLIENKQSVLYSFALETGLGQVEIGALPPRELMLKSQIDKKPNNTLLGSLSDDSATLSFLVRDGVIQSFAVASREGSQSSWKIVTFNGNEIDNKINVDLLTLREPFNKWKRVPFFSDQVEKYDMSFSVDRLFPLGASERSELILSGSAHLVNAKYSTTLKKAQLILVAKSALDLRDMGVLIGTVFANSLLEK